MNATRIERDTWQWKLTVALLRFWLHVVCFFTGDDPFEVARDARDQIVREEWEKERKKEK